MNCWQPRAQFGGSPSEESIPNPTLSIPASPDFCSPPTDLLGIGDLPQMPKAYNSTFHTVRLWPTFCQFRWIVGFLRAQILLLGTYFLILSIVAWHRFSPNID